MLQNCGDVSPTPLLSHIAYVVYKKKKQMRRTYLVTIDKHPLLGAKRESYAIARHILTTYDVTYWYYRITWYQVEVKKIEAVLPVNRRPPDGSQVINSTEYIHIVPIYGRDHEGKNTQPKAAYGIRYNISLNNH